MRVPPVTVLLIVSSLAAGPGAAGADTRAEAAADAKTDDVDELVEPATPTAASYQEDHRLSRSYLVPTLEVIGLEIIANRVSWAAGAPWAKVTFDSIGHNLSSSWVYDDDLFSVNQLGHPYGGAVLFSSARSSGLGFWTSSIYAFVGSLAWETLGETNQPSFNDQLTTAVGGALIGEALHRVGRAVRWGGGEEPSWSRRTLAAVIDPMGAINRVAFGERWRRSPPPLLSAHLGAGLNVPFAGPGGPGGHLELAVSHGLPSDPRFVPRKPFHHFNLRGELDVGAELTGTFDIRGMIVGRATGAAERRTLYGLYGTYDYWDTEGVRAGAFAVGPGVAYHRALGGRDFLEVTAVAALIPLGAAGGRSDILDARDYHYGPGGHELLDLTVGRTGVGAVRLSGRAIQIYGKLTDDNEGNEAVVMTSLSVTRALSTHHALGVDVTYSARSASFEDAANNALDQAAQIRVMYAVTSDSDFAGPDSR